MKIAYIAHPISGDVDGNLADIRRIVRKVNIEYLDIVPFVPYYADVVSMDDTVPSERARGIANDMAILSSGLIDEVWLTGRRVSSGMQSEIENANKMGIPVINHLNL